MKVESLFPIQIKKILNAFVVFAFVPLTFLKIASAQDLILENDTVKVEINEQTGVFSATEKITGQHWEADPWEKAAAILTLRSPNGHREDINLSKSRQVEVQKTASNSVLISFRNPVLANETIVSGGRVNVRLHLEPDRAILNAEVLEVYVPDGYNAIELQYPARSFSLKTDEDRGAGVIPFWQGVIVPSYIFPMNGGRFCYWDDRQHARDAIGELKFYGWNRALSMPWFGTHTENSGVIGILGKNPPAKLKHILNYNGQNQFRHRVSPYPTILSLSPLWTLDGNSGKKAIRYHFLPTGDHVAMAKRYRSVGKKRGYFVSLREKQKENEDVDKLAGAPYIGIYGGYPHYINLKGMAFTYDQLDMIVKDLHEGVGLDRAFIHAWGTWKKHPPKMWPINEELGGTEKLKKVVDRAKRYGYLYSNYHAYTPMLGHDPNLDLSLAPKTEDGQPFLKAGRWNRVRSDKMVDLAMHVLSKEMEVLDQNADVADIAFVGSYKGSTEEENKDFIELAKYLDSNQLVQGVERGGEQWVPYFDFFEGMTYKPDFGALDLHSHRAPLFNLVYHDAVANYGKIQDPDNVNSLNGDFRVKTLRNMLYGIGTNIFFAPYEYEGMKPMLRIANEVLAPVHQATFYEELVNHEYLSKDFKLQRSQFSNGVEVVVNLGPVAQSLPNGTEVERYGYRVRMSDGQIRQGHFETTLSTN